MVQRGTMGSKERVFIAGGTGFIGVRLANFLAARRHPVTVMGQSADRPPRLDPAVEVFAGDGRRDGPWQEHAGRSRLIINLAGASIFTRWTASHKKLIRESRVLTTRRIVESLPADSSGVTLFSTSAVGYYGFRGDESLTEESPPGSDFLAALCRDWEAEAREGEKKGARVAITRFGIVLGKRGGALAQMVPLFRLGVGGPVGTGRQWFSWIHMEDLLGAFFHLLQRQDSRGVYNLTSPQPVRNRDLARSLGRVLRRPSILPAPSFAVRLVLGELGNVILQGQRVIPARLLGEGFRFLHPGIDGALEAVLGKG